MFEWFSPTRIIQGKKATTRVGAEIERLGGKRPLIVTDVGVSSAGLTGAVIASLGDKCAGIFDDVPHDTGLELADEAYQLAVSNGADSVVSVGGGSVIDTAKVLAVLLKEGGKAAGHVGFYVLKRRGVPHVCIPTTAGTGSEVTGVAVLMDRKQSKKAYYLSEHIAPNVAILDPTMTAGMSPALTASTGMDALTHAIEAAVSILKNPFSTAFALGAIRIIRRRLPECVRNGSDLKARAQMQIAATMAGMAFGSAQVGLAHAVSHSLGAICGMQHGIANGIILPTVMRYNAPSCSSEMAGVALALGVANRGQSEAALAEEAAEEVENLLIEINHPRRLAEMGAKPEQVSLCVALALTDAAIISNPRKPITPEEVEKIIIAVF